MIYLISTIIVSYSILAGIVLFRMWQLRAGKLSVEELKRPTISKMLLKTLDSLWVYLFNVSKTGSKHGFFYFLSLLKKLIFFSKLQVSKIERRFNQFLSRKVNVYGSDKGFVSSFLREISSHHEKVKRDLEKVYSRH